MSAVHCGALWHNAVPRIVLHHFCSIMPRMLTCIYKMAHYATRQCTAPQHIWYGWILWHFPAPFLFQKSTAYCHILFRLILLVMTGSLVLKISLKNVIKMLSWTESLFAIMFVFQFNQLLPPPKKEVMFLVRSVCLSVRQITRKLVNGFWRNFLEG